MKPVVRIISIVIVIVIIIEVGVGTKNVGRDMHVKVLNNKT